LRLPPPPPAALENSVPEYAWVDNKRGDRCTAFGEIAKKLKEDKKKIADFQGAVLTDGTFLFADVGKMRQDDGAGQAKWWVAVPVKGKGTLAVRCFTMSIRLRKVNMPQHKMNYTHNIASSTLP
jgi:hypothetical protein